MIETNRGADTSLGGVGRALKRTQTELGTSDDLASIDAAIVQRAARQVYASEFDDRRPEVQALVIRHAARLDRNPREIKRFLNLLRFYAYVAFWRQSAGLVAPDLDGVAKLAILSVRYPQLLTALGGENVLALLEEAAAKKSEKEWDAALELLPDPFRTELQEASDLRTIIREEPKVAETATGFL
jgi:hypothetical protein